MSARATAVAIALLAFFSFASMSPQEPSNVQVVTRLALTLSIVERGALDIDRFADRTVDKALFDGHYYSDKAPGHSLLAVPAVAVARLAFGVLGLPADGLDPVGFVLYAAVATIACNGVLSAIAAGVLFLTALRLGASRQGAVFGSFALCLATPFFGWSTAFFAHSVTASLLVLHFALIAVAHTGERRLLEARADVLGLLFGLLSGFTFGVDFTSAPILGFAALLVLLLARRRGKGQVARLVAGLAIGGVIGLAPLLIYNQLAFGAPFRLGYANVVGFEGMDRGLFGVTWPNPAVLWEVLFGAYRGLLPLSPVLALAPVGLYRLLREPRTRVAGVVVAVAIISFLWINSSYYYWNGGFSTGPRHLVPMLPFLGLALAFAWPRSVWARLGVIALLAVSLCLSAICASVDMFAPDSIAAPLSDYLLPRFFDSWALPRTVALLPVWAVFAWLMVAAGRAGRVGVRPGLAA